MFTELSDTKKARKAETGAAGDVNLRQPAHALLGAVAGLVAFALAVTAIILQSSQGSSGVNPGASQSEIAAAYTQTSGILVWIGAYIQILAYSASASVSCRSQLHFEPTEAIGRRRSLASGRPFPQATSCCLWPVSQSEAWPDTGRASTWTSRR